MSTSNRLPHTRAPSMNPNGAPAQAHSPALVARIAEKRAELDNLVQLKDLSGGLADQMEALEVKLATLADGTQAVAAVLANWHNVLQAINMASIKLASTGGPGGAEGGEQGLPQTLVRIPAEDKEKTGPV